MQRSVDRLLGVQQVNATEVPPEDWWQISLTDKQLEFLTPAEAYGLLSDFSPDSQYVAYIGGYTTWDVSIRYWHALFVMKADGSQVNKILELCAGSNLDWLP